MRIGLTMSVSWAVERDEPRDTVSRYWAGFMARAMPRATWIPVPNLGMGKASAFLDALDLEGIIFTGTGNLGQDPLRDETELDLLEAVIRRGLPAFGSARGLMLLQTRLGGNLEPIGGHLGTDHQVLLSDLPFCRHRFREIPVNSHHGVGITKLASGLLPFAVDPKGRVEGAYHERHRLAGVMWSPEQPGAHPTFDSILVRSVFRYED